MTENASLKQIKIITFIFDNRSSILFAVINVYFMFLIHTAC